MKRLSLVLGATCLLSLLHAATAQAAESPTAGHGSVGALLGYGFEDGLKLGLGVRGGYTLPMNVYLGGTFVYHLGESESAGGIEASANLYYLGFEGGYDIAAGPVVIRPYLGLGAATASVKLDGGPFGNVSDSETRFGAWPGATLIYPIGSAFVGGDARFLIVEDSNAFGLFATGGLQF
jgi:hypothetical protein